MEQNGQLSVILKNKFRPLSPSDLGKSPLDEGYALPLIICGRINRSALSAMALSEKDLMKMIGKTAVDDILLFTVDDGGTEYLVKKQSQKEKRM